MCDRANWFIPTIDPGFSCHVSSSMDTQSQIIRRPFGGHTYYVNVTHHFEACLCSDGRKTIHKTMERRVDRFFELYKLYIEAFKKINEYLTLQKQYEDTQEEKAIHKRAVDAGVASVVEECGITPPAPPDKLSDEVQVEMHMLVNMSFFHNREMQEMQELQLRDVLSYGPAKFHRRADLPVYTGGFSIIDGEDIAKQLRRDNPVRQPQKRIGGRLEHVLNRFDGFFLTVSDGDSDGLNICERLKSQEDMSFTEALIYQRRLVKQLPLNNCRPDGLAKPIPMKGLRAVTIDWASRVRHARIEGLNVYDDGMTWRLTDWFVHRSCPNICRPKIPLLLSDRERNCPDWTERAILVWKYLHDVPMAKRVRMIQSLWNPLRAWVLKVGMLSGLLDAKPSPEELMQTHRFTIEFHPETVRSLFAMASSPTLAYEHHSKMLLRKLVFETGVAFVSFNTKPARKRHQHAQKLDGAKFCKRPVMTGSATGMNCNVPWALPKKKQRDQPVWEEIHSQRAAAMGATKDLVVSDDDFLELDDDQCESDQRELNDQRGQKLGDILLEMQDMFG